MLSTAHSLSLQVLIYENTAGGPACGRPTHSLGLPTAIRDYATNLGCHRELCRGGVRVKTCSSPLATKSTAPPSRCGAENGSTYTRAPCCSMTQSDSVACASTV